MAEHIYILNQSTMNGTVTMDTRPLGIPATSFPEAVAKLKASSGFQKLNAIITNDTPTIFTFTAQGGPDSGGLYLFGILKDDALEMLR